MPACAVENCFNRKRSRGFKFFAVPADPELCEKWYIACGIKDRTKNIRICSRHFLPKDYVPNNPNKLKSDVVPTQNLNPIPARPTRATRRSNSMIVAPGQVEEPEIEEIKEVKMRLISPQAGAALLASVPKEQLVVVDMTTGKTYDGTNAPPDDETSVEGEAPLEEEEEEEEEAGKKEIRRKRGMPHKIETVRLREMPRRKGMGRQIETVRTNEIPHKKDTQRKIETLRKIEAMRVNETLRVKEIPRKKETQRKKQMQRKKGKKGKKGRKGKEKEETESNETSDEGVDKPQAVDAPLAVDTPQGHDVPQEVHAPQGVDKPQGDDVPQVVDKAQGDDVPQAVDALQDEEIGEIDAEKTPNLDPRPAGTSASEALPPTSASGSNIDIMPTALLEPAISLGNTKPIKLKRNTYSSEEPLDSSELSLLADNGKRQLDPDIDNTGPLIPEDVSMADPEVEGTPSLPSGEPDDKQQSDGLDSPLLVENATMDPRAESNTAALDDGKKASDEEVADLSMEVDIIPEQEGALALPLQTETNGSLDQPLKEEPPMLKQKNGLTGSSCIDPTEKRSEEEPALGSENEPIDEPMEEGDDFNNPQPPKADTMEEPMEESDGLQSEEAGPTEQLMGEDNAIGKTLNGVGIEPLEKQASSEGQQPLLNGNLGIGIPAINTPDPKTAVEIHSSGLKAEQVLEPTNLPDDNFSSVPYPPGLNDDTVVPRGAADGEVENAEK